MIPKKCLFLIVANLFGTSIYADVLLDEATKYTHERVFKDHEDPNVFYVAPQAMVLAQSPAEDRHIRYIEYTKSNDKLRAQLDFVMRPALSADLDRSQAMNEILQRNPEARFKVPPYKLIHLKLSSGDKEFVKSFKCDLAKNAIILSFPCSVEIRPDMISFLHDAIARKKILTLDFLYEIRGKVKATKRGKLLNASVRVQATASIEQLN